MVWDMEEAIFFVQIVKLDMKDNGFKEWGMVKVVWYSIQMALPTMMDSG